MNIGAALPPPPRVDPFVNNGGTLGTAVIAEVDGTGRPDIVHCAYLGLQIVLTTSDGELLGYAYAWEQGTLARKPPVLVEQGMLPVMHPRRGRTASTSRW